MRPTIEITMIFPIHTRKMIQNRVCLSLPEKVLPFHVTGFIKDSLREPSKILPGSDFEIPEPSPAISHMD